MLILIRHYINNKEVFLLNLKLFMSKFTIYQFMSAFLVILTLVSIFFYDFGILALVPALISVLTTTILDLIINYYEFKTLEFPYSALISGLFIGGLLTQNLSWHVYVIAGIIAILSKHLIKVHGKHIFNPANFGVLAVFLIFNAQNTWWISSPLILILIFGIFILWRQRRFDLAVSFLAAYYILNAIIPRPSMMGHMPMVSDMPMMAKMPMMMQNFYVLFVNQSTIFFLAMFMLIEPKTHPAARKQRIFYGILVAIMLIGLEVYNPQFRSAIPFVLAVANLFVPLLNRISFEFGRKNVQATV